MLPRRGRRIDENASVPVASRRRNRGEAAGAERRTDDGTRTHARLSGDKCRRDVSARGNGRRLPGAGPAARVRRGIRDASLSLRIKPSSSLAARAGGTTRDFGRAIGAAGRRGAVDKL